VALTLKRLGVTRVRPLEGGFQAWRALGFPVTSITAVVAAGTG
jgi:3-mercaptopyruvate sulfurtransferase SseA